LERKEKKRCKEGRRENYGGISEIRKLGIIDNEMKVGRWEGGKTGSKETRRTKRSKSSHENTDDR
jgi:hypothetical protein